VAVDKRPQIMTLLAAQQQQQQQQQHSVQVEQQTKK
jgi:hypothetical protein